MSMAGVWRKVLQVSGVATEVLGLHAVDGESVFRTSIVD
jgi:hypothetical protein